MPDREKYIEVLSKTAKTAKEYNDYTPIKISLECVEDILELLKEQEVVVRCKDCEHSEPWYGDKSRCFLWHETGIGVFNDGFCNYGKRKEGR